MERMGNKANRIRAFVLPSGQALAEFGWSRGFLAPLLIGVGKVTVVPVSADVSGRKRRPSSRKA